MALISPSRRLRRTPFSDGVEAAGVKAFTVYNRMLLPTMFRSVEEDYHHLKHAVQLWDVSVERQVEVRGPDAGRLIQMLTPRDLRGMLAGQCYYMPVVDETGGMLNDPVVVKLSEDRWWISIADSDLLLWVKGVAYGYRLDVLVDEPDVSPLAVQGPLAEDLMARVFGESIRDVRFFRFGWFDFQGRAMAIARSGYSKQGGFEIYVEGTAAVLRVSAEGPVQQLRPIALDSKTLPSCDRAWPVMAGSRRVGQITSAAQSPDFKEGVAIGMVRMTHWDPGTELSVQTPEGAIPAEVREKYWI